MTDQFQAYADLLNQPNSFWIISKRQKKWLLYGTLGGAGLYLLYRAFKSDTLQALIELRSQLQDGMDGFGQTFRLSSEVSKTVLTDLHHFLNSDDDNIPRSLRQLTKLAKSEEVSQATSRLAVAAVKGLRLATGTSPEDKGAADGQDLLDRLFEALSTEKGSNLVSLAVSMACRSSVQAYCEFGGSSGVSGPNFWQQLLDYGTTPRGEKLYSSCIGAFAREGFKVYMGSLEGVSGWDDLLTHLCKPERAIAVDRMTRSLVNELVVSYFRRARYGLRQETKHSKAVWGKHDKLGQSLAPPLPASVTEVKDRRSLSANEHTNEASGAPGSATEWAAAIVQMSKHAEVRSLVLSIAKTATGEGIRSSMFTFKELLLGNAIHSHSHETQQLTSRNLGTLLLMVFMPIIVFLAGRRSGLA